MGKVFVTSDPHFCHQMEFIWGPRGFKNQYEMNEAIIENWNSVVDMEDDVYCLGDIMLNDNDLGIKCLKSLKGKIHIIRGNHCTNARVAAKYAPFSKILSLNRNNPNPDSNENYEAFMNHLRELQEVYESLIDETSRRTFCGYWLSRISNQFQEIVYSPQTYCS